MKTVLSVSTPTSAAVEAERIIKLQMLNPPKWGVISIKVVYHSGEARRIEVDRKTSMVLDAQGGQ